MTVPNVSQHVIMSNCANLYNTYVTAIAMDAISWKYYIVFVGLNLVYGVYASRFFSVLLTLDSGGLVFLRRRDPRPHPRRARRGLRRQVSAQGFAGQDDHGEAEGRPSTGGGLGQAMRGSVCRGRSLQ